MKIYKTYVDRDEWFETTEEEKIKFYKLLEKLLLSIPY